MSLSRFRSNTDLAAALAAACALAGATGCGDDSCGPGGAPAVGVVASGSAVTMTYGTLVAGLNGDCPAGDAPPGVVSMSIEAVQTDGQGRLTLCFPRPDQLADQPAALGTASGAAAQIFDFAGTASNCTLAIDPSRAVGGTASTTGLCGNGADPAGFALVLDGTASLTRTCGASIDTVAVTLRGRVAVGHR
jgi:hypothetical protein